MKWGTRSQSSGNHIHTRHRAPDFMKIPIIISATESHSGIGLHGSVLFGEQRGIMQIFAKSVGIRERSLFVTVGLQHSLGRYS